MTAWLTLPLLLAAGPQQTQTVGPLIGHLQLDRSELGLADELRLDLSVEGPPPLRVWDDDVLKLHSVWTIRPIGPPRQDRLSAQRERWTRSYWLRAYRVGPLTLPIAPLRVRIGEQPETALIWDAVSGITVQRPEPGEPRPVTTIEATPQPVEPSEPRWPFVLPLLGLLFALGWLLLRRRRGVETHPDDWAKHELSQTDLSPTQLAVILRGYVERRFGVPATRRTTAELAAELQNGLPADAREVLMALLSACDEAKFAPRPQAGSDTNLVAQARAWLTQVQTAKVGNSTGQERNEIQ